LIPGSVDVSFSLLLSLLKCQSKNEECSLVIPNERPAKLPHLRLCLPDSFYLPHPVVIAGMGHCPCSRAHAPDLHTSVITGMIRCTVTHIFRMAHRTVVYLLNGTLSMWARQSGAFSGSTRRAGTIFSFSSVVSRICRVTTLRSFCLAEGKNNHQQLRK
jgi:hypothetical protein